MKSFSELKTSAKAQISGKIGVLFLMMLIIFGIFMLHGLIFIFRSKRII